MVNYVGKAPDTPRIFPLLKITSLAVKDPLGHLLAPKHGGF